MNRSFGIHARQLSHLAVAGSGEIVAVAVGVVLVENVGTVSGESELT